MHASQTAPVSEPKKVPTRPEHDEYAQGAFQYPQRDEEIVLLEGDPPGLLHTGSEDKQRYLIPIGIPEGLFDHRFNVTQDFNLDANVVECEGIYAQTLENMLKQWDSPYVRVQSDDPQDDQGKFDKVRNDYEVLETINELEENADLVKKLIDTPELFSKQLGVSLNFSDEPLIVRIIGTVKPNSAELIRPILDGSAKIIAIKKKLLAGKLSAEEYLQFKSALDCVLTIAEQKHWASVYN